MGGRVCSETFDHTSQLRFLEQITGVMNTNLTQWRRQTVGDLTSAFLFANAGGPVPALPDTNGTYNLAQYEASQLALPVPPYGHQTVPHQERGNRPPVG